MIVDNVAVQSSQIKDLYELPFDNYLSEELRNYNNCIGGDLSPYQLFKAKDNLANAINPECITNRFQFLDVGKYRGINLTGTQRLLSGCGILKGHASSFIKSAKKYKLDPLYFISQSIIETGRGSSRFAKGITISEIADTSKRIFRNNKLVGYKMIKLAKPIKVYNLFGIGAHDASSSFPNKTYILGTTYAYIHGWTSVDKAISGAAEFLSTNYIHGKYKQNTPYKLRFINGDKDSIWHQYCSDINYAKSISNMIVNNSYLYNNKDTFNFCVPVFKNNINPVNSSYTLTAGGDVLFRTEPSLNSTIITTIPNRTPVKVIKKSGRWLYIKYNNKYGWAHSRYVKV